MRERVRNGAAILIGGMCVAIAIQALLAPQLLFTGITLRREGPTLGDLPTLVVAAVDPASGAYGLIQPGTIIQEVNYAPSMTVPSRWTDGYLQGDFVELGVANSSGGLDQYTFPATAGTPVAFVFLVGLSLLIGIAIWVRRGQAGEALRPLAFPLAVAAAAPLILAPTSVSPSWLIVVGGVALATVALLLVADGWLERVVRPVLGRIAAVIAVAAAVAYIGAEVVLLSVQSTRAPIREMEYLFVLLPSGLTSIAGVIARSVPPLLATSITMVPAAALLISGRGGARRPTGSATARSQDRIPVILAALTPVVVAVTFGYGQLGFGLSLPLIWLLFVVFMLQSQARVETLRFQRDSVVAATEAERARLAADLHDDALQDMTVLVRRLDGVGDRLGAALARSIADELREVCGDLRLPVLDELGAGAALEWLVSRAGEVSGGGVQLERDDPVRPPADVELAVFRVAQEALANAVSHGAPPIVVRYVATSVRASLSVTDQGRGIAPGAAAEAALSGHYGLINMRQRAEQVGAKFDVRRVPAGGTAIRLSWFSP